MGPRAGLDRCGKSRPPPGFDRRTVQPVASRYTELPGPQTPESVSCAFRFDTEQQRVSTRNTVRAINNAAERHRPAVCDDFVRVSDRRAG